MERLRGAAETATTHLPSTSRRQRQPSNYPFPTTYIINSFSFISAAIVTGTVGYFTYYLRQDSMSVPYQFILLISISSVTLWCLIFSTYTHVFGPTSPKLSLITNAALLIGWLVGLGLITGKIGGMVLGHACSTTMWQTDMGVMVCRIYKAMYSFLVIGTASIAASVILDVIVLREASARGAYREMKDGSIDTSYQGHQRERVGEKLKGGRQGAMGLGRTLSGMAAKRSGFGLRGGSFEMNVSPPLGSAGMETDDGEGDMGQRLVGKSPDLRNEYGSPDLSEYEKTPKL